MSKAQVTKSHIIEQAATVFNQQGYAGTSMSDLMRVTGLKKGGIYNHFGSKDELAIAAFDYAVKKMHEHFRGAMKGKRHAVDRLMAVLSVYERMGEQPPIVGGCPILNTAVESDDTHPALRERAKAAVDSWRLLFERIIEKGINRGELKEGTNADEVATVLISTLEGAVMLSRLYSDDEYVRRALVHLRQYILSEVAAAS
ncbi:MAG: TetR family transcriptional regulator C-terminal domain-containing protein [Phormidesmis sp.]